MTTEPLYRVEVENGKYTFIVGPTGSISCLRYGEPWIAEGEITIGSKAIFSLIAELSEAREQIELLETQRDDERDERRFYDR